MDIGGFFKKAANTVGGLAGIKPFGGQDYADGGHGDVALDYQKRNDAYAGGLGDYGSMLMKQYQPQDLRAMNGANPALTGYNAGIPSAVSMYAKSAGLNYDPSNPSSNQMTDPYALDNNDQQALNQGIGTIGKARQTAERQLRTSLAARGITQGPQLDDAMARLHDTYDAHIQQHATDFHTQRRQDKQNALKDIVSYQSALGGLQNGLGQQQFQNAQGLIGQGAGLVGQAMGNNQNAIGLNQQVGQQKAQEQANSYATFSNLAGFAAGGGFNRPANAASALRPSLGGTPGQSGNGSSAMTYGDLPGYSPYGAFGNLGY